MPTIYSSSLWLNEIQSFKIQSFVAMHIRWKLIFQLIYFDTRNIKCCFFLFIQKSKYKCPTNIAETTAYLLHVLLLPQRYNKDLAAQAQAHADSCVEAHSGLASENIFYSSGLFRSVIYMTMNKTCVIFNKIKILSDMYSLFIK